MVISAQVKRKNRLERIVGKALTDRAGTATRPISFLDFSLAFWEGHDIV
jgi:hypothetical protein